MAEDRESRDRAGLRRGLSVPCFAEDPADLVELGVGAERAGLDGYFLWDHLVHADSGAGLPPIVDPWQVLAVVAARTSRIKLGTMITPVARRRPWKLAKEVTTLDLLSGGRVILGVGLGAPASEFGLFGEPTDARHRAELLDEGLAVLAGLCSGQHFSHAGQHFTVGPVRFSPTPVQRPRVPIWVGGVFPSDGPLARAARRVAGMPPVRGPVARAARWDGFVPIHPGQPGERPTTGEIAAVRDRIAGLRGTTADFDIAIWGELDSAGQVTGLLRGYREAGATWWIESPGSGAGWLDAVRERLQGPTGRGPR